MDKKKRNVLQNFLVATDSSLSAAENVALVQFVEKETIKLAKSRGFKSIFTSNSSPLTQVSETFIFELTIQYYNLLFLIFTIKL